MSYVQPDKSVVSIRPEDIDDLPIPEEAKEALRAFWTEEQTRKSREKAAEEKAYQTAQAEVVIDTGGWEEVLVAVDAPIIDVVEGNWDTAGDAVDEINRGMVEGESVRPIGRLFRFYNDLYPGLDIKPGVDGIDPDRPFEDHRVLVNHKDRVHGRHGHPYQVYMNYGDLMRGVSDETSFIYLGSFWEPVRNGKRFPISKKNAMTHINGFCVDLDRVEDDQGRHFGADWVMRTLFEFLDKNKPICPNYLMLSGTGVQLWYVFRDSIPLLSKDSIRRRKYDVLIKRLYSYFEERLPKNRFKVDKACAAYNHAFRAPGSPSKFGYPSRLFVHEPYFLADPLAISDYIGGDLKQYDVGEWDQELFEKLTGSGRTLDDPASEKQLAYIRKLHSMKCVPDDVFSRAGEMSIAEADAAIKQAEGTFTRTVHYHDTGGGVIVTSEGHEIKLKSRNRALYDYMVKRIYQETRPGSRYMAMFALAGMAYNCNIAKSSLERDLRNLKESEWGHKPSPTDGKPIDERDIKSALMGYNPIGCLRPREIIENLVGWSFAPPAKRNGRDQRTHLHGEWKDPAGDEVPNKCMVMRTAACEMRNASRAKGKLAALADFLRDNPTASKRRACKALGMSLTTVSKYWPGACEAAGIKDVRSGNHCRF